MTDDIFVEMEYSQFTKTGQAACGDDLQFMTIDEENRRIVALSDGLGSGVKAHVLANMTTTMALRFLQSNTDMLSAVTIIMDSLPVCEVRKISYATFSLLDLRLGGDSRLIEMGNPEYIQLRGTEEVAPLSDSTIVSERWPDREVRQCKIRVQVGDRIILCSDGVSQSGLGAGLREFKFGWRRKGILEFAQAEIAADPRISAKDLARRIACFARNITPEKCYDDITCCVIYMRAPRVMRVMSGPPFYKEHDPEFALQATTLGEPHTVICGGTTANILERELGKKVKLDLTAFKRAGNLPPPGMLPDVGIVTEGILTLGAVTKALEECRTERLALAAQEIVNRILEHDRIEFIIGTKVNETHQDPNLPQDLELRRSVIRRLASALEKNYRKQVTINFY